MARFLQLQGKDEGLRDYARGVMDRVVRPWDLKGSKSQMQLVQTLQLFGQSRLISAEQFKEVLKANEAGVKQMDP